MLHALHIRDDIEISPAPRDTVFQFENILWKLQFNFTCEVFANYNLVTVGNTMFALEGVCNWGKLKLKSS